MKDFRAPNEDQVAERSWEVVRAAYETREPVAWPRRHWRPLAVGAVVAAAVAAVLSPPGRSVVHSLRKAVGDENHEYCYACYTGDYPTDLVNIEQLIAAKKR